MNSADEPQLLLSVGDGEAGCKTRLLLAFEKSGIRSLERPIEIDGTGPDSWVIA